MAAGDEQAIAAFYRTYFARLYQKARRATGRDEAFCRDVVQESVLRILRCVRPIEGEGPFRAWLRLVVQSTAYDLLKSESRRTRREAVAVVPCGGDTPEEPQECAEQLAWLRNQLAAMDCHISGLIAFCSCRKQMARNSKQMPQSITISPRRLFPPTRQHSSSPAGTVRAFPDYRWRRRCQIARHRRSSRRGASPRRCRRPGSRRSQ
ncbi:MAG: RNA polymerase sigma factor [Thermoguttaceae bacterium]